MSERRFFTPYWQLRRNTDPWTSDAAARKVDTNITEGDVYDAIKSAGQVGMTADELKEHFGFFDQRNKFVSYSGITSPPCQLERKFYIIRPYTRKGIRSGEQQLVNIALPDEERERLQNEFEDKYGPKIENGLSGDEIFLLFSWYHVNEELQRQNRIVEATKLALVESLLPGVDSGKYIYPVFNDRLVVQFKSNGVDIEIRKGKGRG